MTRRILVIGAGGMLGAPVAKALLAAGNQVRVTSRAPEALQRKLGPGFEAVQADVEDEESLRVALDGCDGVHVNLMGGPSPDDFDRVEHLGTARVARVATSLGVERLTYLSGAPVGGNNLHDPGTKAKHDAEQAIRGSGVNHTIFRVTWLMESLELFIQGNRAIVVGEQAHPVRWIAADDYASQVADSYEMAETVNKTLFLVGPEAVSKADAIERYCERVRPDLKFTKLPVWLMRIVAGLSFNAQLRTDVRRLAFYDTIGDDFGDPAEAMRLLGAASTTLDEWFDQRAANDP